MWQYVKYQYGVILFVYQTIRNDAISTTCGAFCNVKYQCKIGLLYSKFRATKFQNTKNSVGNITLAPDDLFEGMVFKNKGHFKQHMALYALRNKFRFKNTRSSPEGMVMNCMSGTCQWRVYATKMKNVESYEVKKAKLHHTFSVDDRVGNSATNLIKHFPSFLH